MNKGEYIGRQEGQIKDGHGTTEAEVREREGRRETFEGAMLQALKMEEGARN